MTIPARLNQLQLVDDTRIGLFLVWAYIVLDATQQRDLGAFWLTWWTGNSSRDARWSVLESAVQVALVLSLAGAIGYFRLRRLLSRVRPRKLSDTDAVLDAGASSIARGVVKRSPLFLTTSNLTDTNACCVLSFPRQYVIVGGGLRLLWRKAPAQAAAILAHECMHLAKRDTLLLIGTWYTFIAYCLLLVFNFSLNQAYFWSQFVEKIPSWKEAGLDVARGVGPNVLVIGVAGFPSVISALVIGLILRHMMRLREFMADEGAAQHGYRQGIADNLARLAQDKPFAFRLLRSFHPSARDRFERLVTGAGWARVDRLFCFAAGLIIVRVASSLPQPIRLSCDAAKNNQIFWNELVACVQTDMYFFPVLLCFFAIFMGLSFLVFHHAYRTLMTRRARCRYWGDAVHTMAEVWGFATLGAILGMLSTKTVLTTAGEILLLGAVPAWNKVDVAIGFSISASLIFLVMTIACGLVVEYAAKRPVSSGMLRPIGFGVLILMLLFFSHGIVNYLPALMYEYGGIFRLKSVEGWGVVTNPVMGLLPSLRESFLFWCGLVLMIVLASYAWAKFRVERAYSPSDLNQERLLPNSDFPICEVSMLSSVVKPTYSVRPGGGVFSVAASGAVVLALFLLPLRPQKLEPPTRFSFDYPYGDKAGIRVWAKNDEGLWSERYPDGKIYGVFREAGRIRQEGCVGTIVERQDLATFKVFIPDKGCKKMWLWAKSGAEKWAFLGEMKKID
ncbi:M48 family metalloprotease [Achromobacter anxifer]